MAKLRVVAYQVQVVAFVDDGSTLEPLEIQPITIKVSDIAGFDWDNALSPVREQIEGQAPAAPVAGATARSRRRTPGAGPATSL